MAFERLPEAGTTRFTGDVLRVERDLHMDMLRESGRRADAHVVRYALASQLVHKGDRVIDAACGLGYGGALVYDGGLASSILGIDSSGFAVDYANAIFADRRPRLTFTQDDVHCIARLPEESAEVVISFETLEHIADPRAFVAQAERVLSPGGRFICSVPNQWLDESGRDPNPYHLHVFDLPKLLALFDDGLSNRARHRPDCRRWHEAPWRQAHAHRRQSGRAVRRPGVVARRCDKGSSQLAGNRECHQTPNASSTASREAAPLIAYS